MKNVFVLLIPFALFACNQPTQFHGEPKFPDGASGCRQACQKEGLEMAGFVFSGEFSTSCVCAPPRTTAPGSSGEAAPTAGVFTQMQLAAAAAAAAQQQQMIRQQQAQSIAR